MKEKTEKFLGTKKLFILLIVLLIVVGALMVYKFIFDKNDKYTSANADFNSLENNVEETIKVKLPETFSGNERPIAVMIDNHIDAMPQAALLESDVIYEIIVEGGETRLMAVMKGKDLDKIGPIRSSRHYFLDYALENDAIYVHYGWSPQAQGDISSLGVNNVNGLVESESSFWRVSDKEAPHNAVSSTKDILKIAERDDYRTTSNKKTVLNYVADEVELDSDINAEEVYIKYSDYNSVRYEYDKESKKYIRYSRGEKQVDWDSGETILTKNIIVTFVENWTLDDGSGKGRQTLDNLGTHDGYYITNGKAIKITCEKESRESQTVYRDLDGNEIKVNDGKTFIQIVPINANVEFDD